MEDFNNLIKGGISAILVVLGGFNLILILIILMIIDFATGSAYAFINKKISSNKMIGGAYRKLMILVGIFAMALITIALTNYLYEIPQIEQYSTYINLLPKLFLAWFMIGEFISILENMERSGVKLPKFIKKITGRLQNHIDKE